MRLTKGEVELFKKAGYSEKIIELYIDMTHFGFIENPDVALDYKGPCGDIIKFYLNIKENGVIEDVRFQYIGCLALAACGSIVTGMVKGKSLLEVKERTEDDVLMQLNGLPDDECHCAKLAVTALHKTIQKYEGNVKKA